MAQRLPTLATNQSGDVQFAGYEQRLYACAIDMLLLLFVSVLFHFYQNGFFMLLAQGCYFIFCWYRFCGKTLGNKLMRIQVVSVDGKKLSFGQACLRYLGFLLSEIVFFLGFIWIFWNKKRQGWHDTMAHTLVIKA